MPQCEIIISNTTTSSFFEGNQHVVRCNSSVIINQFQWQQPNNTNLPHYYNGSPDYYTYVIEIWDQFGNQVVIGEPGSGAPQAAAFPTGDRAMWMHNGCGNPANVIIFH